MTRTEGVLAAASTAKESVRHAAEAVAPYAETARDAAAHYAHEANARLAPKVSGAAQEAARQARVQYGAHVAPRLVQARDALPAQVDDTAVRMVRGTRSACRHAADYVQPRFECGGRCAAGGRGGCRPVFGGVGGAARSGGGEGDSAAGRQAGAAGSYAPGLEGCGAGRVVDGRGVRGVEVVGPAVESGLAGGAAGGDGGGGSAAACCGGRERAGAGPGRRGCGGGARAGRPLRR